MPFMTIPFDDILAALVALLKQPVAVASLIVLAGINAAIWLVVFERVGFPTALASLLIVPPLTFLLPLYVVIARWPSQRFVRLVRLPTRRRTVSARPTKRIVRRPPVKVPGLDRFEHHGPLRLSSDGLPKYRIPLLPSVSDAGWPAIRKAAAQVLYP